MAFQTPVTKTLLKLTIIRTGTAPQGGPFIECETNQGVVAFWGETNIKQIQANKGKFDVTCGCIKPNPPWSDRHDLWVPEKQRLKISRPKSE